MNYIVTSSPIFHYEYDKSQYKIIYLLPSIKKEILSIAQNGLSNYISNLARHCSGFTKVTLFDRLVTHQNGLCEIDDAAMFVLVNCVIIIGSKVLDHCKQRGIHIVNVHPGPMIYLGRYPLLRSSESGIYGVMCHNVTRVIDDTTNPLFVFETRIKDGPLFVREKTEYILRMLVAQKE